jgi:chorismate mutase / prephenate dehydratase
MNDSTKDPKLQAFRREIDTIDEKIIALLAERVGIVQKVGEHKKTLAERHPCPIRPGREADMVRRIMQSFEGTGFSPAAAAGIWRIIIGASTARECDLKIAVFAPDREHDLYWLAREYFGPSVPVSKHTNSNRVIGDVMDDKAAVGIVPFLRGDDTTHWWRSLMQEGPNTPKVFAHVPFVYTDIPGKIIPSALAIAKLEPEPSGDDTTLLVIEAEHNTSQHRLQTAFATAKLDVNWITAVTLSPTTRHHLVEVKGFITHTHEAFAGMINGLGSALIRASILGAYANPASFDRAQGDTKNVQKKQDSTHG